MSFFLGKCLCPKEIKPKLNLEVISKFNHKTDGCRYFHHCQSTKPFLVKTSVFSYIFSVLADGVIECIPGLLLGGVRSTTG